MALKLYPPSSPREQQIKQLLLEGCSTKEIARTLNISPSTVGGFITQVYEKEKVHNRHELRAKFYLKGIVNAP